MENGVEYWKAVELDADDPEGTNRFILQNPGNNNDPMTGERLLRIQHSDKNSQFVQDAFTKYRLYPELLRDS